MFPSLADVRIFHSFRYSCLSSYLNHCFHDCLFTIFQHSKLDKSLVILECLEHWKKIQRLCSGHDHYFEISELHALLRNIKCFKNIPLMHPSRLLSIFMGTLTCLMWSKSCYTRRFRRSLRGVTHDYLRGSLYSTKGYHISLLGLPTFLAFDKYLLQILLVIKFLDFLITSNCLKTIHKDISVPI